MHDVLVWGLTILLALIPLLLVYTFAPFYLYNIAWRALRTGDPLLPVMDPSRRRSAAYYRLSGIAPRIFGLSCLLLGASTHLLPVLLVVGGCGTRTATPIQRAVGWTWIASLVPVITSRYWVPAFSRNPERIREPSATQKLFFWHGVLRVVKRRFGGGAWRDPEIR
ncbi:MAG TPA: hypothetical protein VF188_13360 [Longimicrobiales bacterium]